MSLIHWLTLSLTPGIGPILSRRVIEAAGSVEAACAVTLPLLRTIEGIGSAKAEKIAAGLRQARSMVNEELARVDRGGGRVICPDDGEYPALLHEIPDPPMVLYIRGTLEPRDLHAVAIVGSRKCSFYGREQAERFGALLAGAGVVVVSGGARGIDSAAHRGALQHPQGRTLAVLGSGVDIAYPPENERLFAQIAERGAVISEFPMGTEPAPENFPRRNRIVSGMSRGVLVVEADEKSGALITARQAIDDHNRIVFALPGRVDNATSAGPHKLIRDGATLVRNLEDILEELPPLPESVGTMPSQGKGSQATFAFEGPKTQMAADNGPILAPTTAGVTLSDRQSTLLGQFSGDPLSVDQLINLAALPAHVVLQELTFLSLRGLVKRVDGQTYEKGRGAR
jgi:DNA processing protein